MERCVRGRGVADNNIVRRMRFPSWIAKATDTHRICSTFCITMATVVKRTHNDVTFIRTLPVFFYFHLLLARRMDGKGKPKVIFLSAVCVVIEM